MSNKEIIEKVKLLDGLRLKDIAEKITNLSIEDRIEFLSVMLVCERWKCANEIFKEKQKVVVDYNFLKSVKFDEEIVDKCITASQSYIQDYSSQLVFEKNSEKSIAEWKEIGLDCTSIKKL